MNTLACQRWRDHRHSWRRPEDGGFDPARYGVAEISDDSTAKGFVLDHHYSGTYPAAAHRYGLYDLTGTSPELTGVAVLSVPPSRGVLTGVFPGLEPYAESLELGRFVLTDDVPANGESWFLGQVLRMAAQDGVRGVVSFSDPVPRYDEAGLMTMPGHLGIIYQASNATYTGRGTPRTLTLLRDGTVFSDRAQQKIRSQDKGHEYAEQLLITRGARPMQAGEQPSAWLAQALSDAGTRKQRHPGNHRYAFRAGTRPQRAAVAIALPGQPYPKNLPEAA